MKRRTRAKLPYPLNVLDPQQLFELVCIKYYFAGQFDKKAPVDEAREAYKELVRMIISQSLN